MTLPDPTRRSALSAGAMALTALAAAPSLAAGASNLPSPPTDQMGKRIDATIARAVAEERVVGAVVTVSIDGAVAYQRAFGWADREARRPMQVGTAFRLASITKPVVTLAALRLVELGQLRLDAPVTDYLPTFRPKLPGGEAPVITIAQLLLHTSGLGYGFEEDQQGAYARLGVSDGLDSSRITLAENLRRLAQAPLYFAPGTQWRYSLGLDVVGAVIERVRGQPLPHAVDALVLQPAGVKGFRFVSPRSRMLATPYADGKPQPVRMTRDMRVTAAGAPAGTGVVFDPGRAYAANAFPSGGGGMQGTAPGLLELLEIVRTGGAPVLRHGGMAPPFQALVGEQAQTQGPGWGFGLGGAVLVDPAAAHTPQSAGTLQWGGAYGHNWFVDPARRLSVVMLTNTAFEGMNGALTTELRDAVYGVTAPA